ncbi:MAG: glycosyltransferase family 4 protein [Bacteroidales bacterium]|jgi:glycosyltransferase involved in cell wall biosynthesis|nr:glycosyltransferase family 4 protein [Bacteroidales bacterium]
MNLLICSALVPYDKVSHAGGQAHNYYVKRLRKETGINIHLITFAFFSEIEKVDLDKYNISNTVIYLDKNIAAKIIRKVITLFDRFFLWIKYAELISSYRKYKLWKELKKLKKKKYVPDIIELDWTQAIVFLPMIKNIYPDAKYCAVEHDVVFQRLEREYRNQSNIYKQLMTKLKYHGEKKMELSLLSKFDMVFTFNNKDKMLLENNGIHDSCIIAPVFKKISFPVTTTKKNTILFYGSMNRSENYLSAIWFIKNVFSRMEDMDISFIILGATPHPSLLAYQNDKIIITGYQDDITPWFEQAMCLVTPLVSGAGIKIKVLEALAAGIPVLGNDIAVEGIDITNNVEYFHCMTPEDYITTIKIILKEPDFAMSVGLAGQKYINENYDSDKSFKDYVNNLYSLVKFTA